jgi:hypothetical protein
MIETELLKLRSERELKRRLLIVDTVKLAKVRQREDWASDTTVVVMSWRTALTQLRGLEPFDIISVELTKEIPKSRIDEFQSVISAAVKKVVERVPEQDIEAVDLDDEIEDLDEEFKDLDELDELDDGWPQLSFAPGKPVSHGFKQPVSSPFPLPPPEKKGWFRRLAFFLNHISRW